MNVGVIPVDDNGDVGFVPTHAHFGTREHDLLLELELFLLVHFLLFSGVFFWNKIADKEHLGKMIFS
jgi:hypothetical protein